MSDGKLRSNRHCPTIDDLKEHCSEVLALVTNNEPNQNDDDEMIYLPLPVNPQRTKGNIIMVRTTRRGRSGTSAFCS